MMSRKLTFARYRQLRLYSTKIKLKISDSLNEKLLNEDVKHRLHPGILKPRIAQQPANFYKTIRDFLKDEHLSKNVIYENGNRLASHLHGRHAPPESEDYKAKLNEVRSRLKKDEEEEDLLKDREAKKLYKSLVYNWVSINYDQDTCLSYAVSRSPAEYCVLYKIFNEIKVRDADFAPKSVFDFGSGVGTVMWATSEFWVRSIKEYYCVDASVSMNELSAYLVKRIRPTINFNYVFHRQFLPASATPTYDIVVSAYSLLELPNQRSRLEVLAKLWQKTSKYLVIVEQGTKAAFDLVVEARDFVLQCSSKKSGVHVFSPCPHDLQCPRIQEDDAPCSFELNYLTLPIPKTSEFKRERYSYVILKKENRADDDENKWPRIVRPVLKRSRHVICRMCTGSGELQEHIFTAWKNGKNTYRCARSSEWGDRLPVTKIEEVTAEEERMDDAIHEEEKNETTEEHK
ncbi:ribosome assembly protein METTL17, mitochondrial [Lasioglossum baleicum]|uniref:ribosome assembly protein METTL17, mitochondrial n=1 Tax=Lasioglossum baleicum TaxID=434251 RepID=UPI003FCD1374